MSIEPQRSRQHSQASISDYGSVIITDIVITGEISLRSIMWNPRFVRIVVIGTVIIGRNKRVRFLVYQRRCVNTNDSGLAESC